MRFKVIFLVEDPFKNYDNDWWEFLDKELRSVRIWLKGPGLQSGIPIKLSGVGLINFQNLD